MVVAAGVIVRLLLLLNAVPPLTCEYHLLAETELVSVVLEPHEMVVAPVMVGLKGLLWL